MNLDEVMTSLYQQVVRDASDSEISYQRQRNYRAYYMEPLESDEKAEGDDSTDAVGGRTDFRTSDVFDTVEDTKSALSETFAPHRNTIRFKRTGPDDEAQVDLANEYVKEVFWNKNHGAEFVRDASHDGCLAKNAIAKVYWKEDEEAEEMSVGPLTPEQVLVALEREDVEPAQDFEATEIDGMMAFTGNLTVTRDTSYQCLELVAPENFFGDEDATSERGFLCAQDRVQMTFDELQELGASQQQIDSLNPYEADGASWSEDLARHTNDSTEAAFFEQEVVIEGQDEVWVYNAHFISDLDGNGPRPWYVKYCGMLLIGDEDVVEYGEMTMEEAIEKEYIKPLSRLPYHTWSPYPLSHRWTGMASADPVYMIQEMRTKMHRSIIDYMSRTNNPRLQSDAENIRNYDEFIENPIGGFADLEDPTTPIMAVDQPQMSPLVFQALEMVTQERDERVPVTRLGSGRNQDVISNQNAESMVEKMAARGDKRMATIARNFAIFLKNIMLDLYQVGIEHDEKPVVLEIQGDYQQVIPKELPRYTDMVVRTALTPQEAQTEAMQLLTMHQSYLADPVLNQMYLPTDRYQLMGDVAELMDKQTNYLSSPDSDEYKSAMMQQQQAMEQQTQQHFQMQQALLGMQGQFQQQIEGMKAELRRFEIMMDAQQKERDQDREEFDSRVNARLKAAQTDKTEVDTEAQAIENTLVKAGVTARG